mgnify:CR=1 FL=1
MHTTLTSPTSSKLLTAETPLILQPSLVNAFGVVGATFLQQLHYISSQSSLGIMHGGFKWIYNTMEQWQRKLSCWSKSTIERTVARLSKLGVLLIDQLNPHKYNRTNYYRIDYSKIAHLGVFEPQVTELIHPVNLTVSSPQAEVIDPCTLAASIPAACSDVSKSTKEYKTKKKKVAIEKTTTQAAVVATQGSSQPTQPEPCAEQVAQIPHDQLLLWRQLRMLKLDIAPTDPRLREWISRKMVKTVLQTVMEVTDRRWYTPEQLGLASCVGLRR